MSFKYFTKEEFACSHTGNNEIEDKFIEMLMKNRIKVDEV